MNSMATGYSAPGRMVAHNMVTTQFELDGFRVTRTLGVVRGIVVRSRSIFGTIGASLQTILGGNITLLTNLCEKTRAEAFDLMLQHAAELGGNAVVGRSLRRHRSDAGGNRSAGLRHRGSSRAQPIGLSGFAGPFYRRPCRDGRPRPSRPSAARQFVISKSGDVRTHLEQPKACRALLGPDGSETRPYMVAAYFSSFSIVFCRYANVRANWRLMKNFSASAPSQLSPTSYSITSRTTVPFTPFLVSACSSWRW